MHLKASNKIPEEANHEPRFQVSFHLRTISISDHFSPQRVPICSRLQLALLDISDPQSTDKSVPSCRHYRIDERWQTSVSLTALSPDEVHTHPSLSLSTPLVFLLLHVSLFALTSATATLVYCFTWTALAFTQISCSIYLRYVHICSNLFTLYSNSIYIYYREYNI